MHRILSYQTAVQANDERDVREYVTKRTCVSLILSIAFFTLISGFLLGKFVADRQHHIKELDQTQLQVLEKMRTVERDLIEIAQPIIKNVTSYEVHEKINRELYVLYTSCVQYSKPHFHENLVDFIYELIGSQSLWRLDCIRGLDTYIKRMLNQPELLT